MSPTLHSYRIGSASLEPMGDLTPPADADAAAYADADAAAYAYADADAAADAAAADAYARASRVRRELLPACIRLIERMAAVGRTEAHSA